MSDNKGIWVKRSRNLIEIEIREPLTFQNAGGLRNVFRHAMGTGRFDFILYCEECPVMDSTGAGTIASMALELKRCSLSSGLRITGVRDRVWNDLKKLGLDSILDIDRYNGEEGGSDPLSPVSPEPSDPDITGGAANEDEVSDQE